MKQYAFLAILALASPLAFLPSCAAPPAASANPAVQSIVDRVVANHPEIVRLTIHAVPTGESSSRVIACNLPEYVGRASHDEDLAAMATGKPTVLKEGECVDYTSALRDVSGLTIAATGITLKGAKDGITDDDRIAQAKAIVAEIESAFSKAISPLW